METFNYDPVGNRTNSNQNGLSSFNQANALLEDANFTYQYDNNGNMTRKTAKAGGAITTYEYDAENKLVRVVSPINTANYRYDGLGRRVEKEIISVSTTVTRCVYDNEDILLELDGSNAIIARYTHGPGIDEPLVMEKGGAFFFYHADGLGSITELTNQSGTIVQRYTYSSFGKIESQLDPNFVQPYTFTSREFDLETGLYFYRNRNLDPFTGRFTTVDPLGFAGGDVNLYRYVKGNPVRYIDPSGLDSPGCDMVPEVCETPCVLESCAQHDKCYDDNKCSASSWLPYVGLAECKRCNSEAKTCILKCGKSKYDDPKKPNYYCAKLRKFISIPGDFPDLQSAVKACSTN